MTEFKIQLRKRNIPPEELLADLKRVALSRGKATLTASEYAATGQFGVNTMLRKFGQWNQALREAGLEAPNRQHVPEQELFENIASVWTRIGHQPLGREMEKEHGLSSFSLGTYESRFGSWNKALLAFEAFINDRAVGPVTTLCGFAVPTGKRTLRKINWRLRAQVLIRDSCICQMCGASPAKQSDIELHADHIKAWSRGGETVLENLQTLCAMCNIGKSDMLVEKG